MNSSYQLRPSAHGEGRTVLIMGESDADLFLETVLLSHACYRAIAVAPVDLYAAIKEHRPALVVLAVERDGAALRMMQLLRGDPTCSGTSLLATAARGAATRADILGAGANSVVWKALEPRAFMRQVDRLARVAPRTRVDTAVALTPARGRGSATLARTVNLSISGVLVRSACPLRLGARYTLRTAAGGEVTIDGQVTRVAWEHGHDHYALQFARRVDAAALAGETGAPLRPAA